MINILVCDDDKRITDEVLQQIDEIKSSLSIDFNVDVKHNGDFILRKNNRYDIAIVDIEMPLVGGLELSEKLKQSNPDIIIIVLTSYSDYLDSAMKIKVFRYLSKPLDHNRFKNNFLEALQAYKQLSHRIVIEYAYEVFTVKTTDILYIENRKHGSLIKTKYDSFITNKKPLEWSKIINQPNCFVSSHKSYIVNLSNVTNFNRSCITFCNDIEVACISQRKYSQFKKAFFDFAGGIR